MWTAELTDAGRHYVEHGDYPVDPVQVQPSPRPASSDRGGIATEEAACAEAQGRRARPGADARPEDEIPIKQLIVKPHPAVRELRNRPRRLPKFAQRRCQLIAHALVTEALDRGWEVTALPSRTGRDYYGKRTIKYDHDSHFFIDAGHARVGFIFDEKQTRIDHVDTPEEAAKRAKGQYVYAPRFDFLPTGLLRLHLVTGGTKDRSTFMDGPRARIEDKIPGILARIEKASADAVASAERSRLLHEQWAAEQRERERIAELRKGYEKWEVALHEQADAWARQQQLSEFVEAAAALPDEQRRDSFIEWARAHLDALDPRLQLPHGDQPEWTHEQRVRNGRLTTPLQPSSMSPSYR